IEELQAQGYAVPDFPDLPKTDEEIAIRQKYAKVLGSAVNPVLREGNSDRRAPASVKQYARQHPHTMGKWTAESKTNVAHMDSNDFFSNEKSIVMDHDDSLRIEFVAKDGSTKVLRESVKVIEGEVVDGTFMSADKLDAFLKQQITRAKDENLLFS